ncbi:hypothetical protein [Gorillibacterium sp. CAU 1737]|uniref:hypothetical protein n=1 Tax=Gorillibacterium sp. CAU 1737 TaxID=3140362 RepID=UPI003261A5C9
MKQYFIHADMFDEEYQQLYIREENAVVTETAFELVRHETGSIVLVSKAACLEITSEEFEHLSQLGESSSYGREAFAVITSKLGQEQLQSV